VRTKNNHIVRRIGGRRLKQLLSGFKEKRKYYNLKQGGDLVLEMATDMSKDRLDNEYA